MSRIKIESIINDVENASRIHRNNAAEIVWNTPELFEDLLHLTFDVNNKKSIKAAWILEWICTHKSLDIILPHLEYFTENIKNVYLDSGLRPCAKICEHLAVAYTSKNKNLTKEALTQNHIESIIETGFDWLMTPQKIAVLAYTMQTLYLFGLDKKWVHPELSHLIKNKIIYKSKGCEARGKKILFLIEKHQKSTL